MVPDGIRVDSGVTGRVVRLGRAQHVPDVRSDSDHVAALPGVVSELALPLLVKGTVVGVLNVESERGLPAGAEAVFDGHDDRSRRLPVRSPPAACSMPARALFVHVGSMRDPDQIAAIGAASLPKILPLELSQVLLWDEAGLPVSSPLARGRSAAPLSLEEIVRVRDWSSPRSCASSSTRTPRTPIRSCGSLRANGEEIGAHRAWPRRPGRPVQLDTAAVLAHVAASLDAALALQRERESAMTDPLTGVWTPRARGGSSASWPRRGRRTR